MGARRCERGAEVARLPGMPEPTESDDATRLTQPPPMRRFLRLEDVAEILATSPAQVYALVRRGDLAAIKLGGRGQWRIETTVLEEYIARLYAETREWVEGHPLTGSRSTGDTPDSDSDLPTLTLGHPITSEDVANALDDDDAVES
jgi:excisionase family DNA binding protein